MRHRGDKEETQQERNPFCNQILEGKVLTRWMSKFERLSQKIGAPEHGRGHGRAARGRRGAATRAKPPALAQAGSRRRWLSRGADSPRATSAACPNGKLPSSQRRHVKPSWATRRLRRRLRHEKLRDPAPLPRNPTSRSRPTSDNRLRRFRLCCELRSRLP